MKNKKDSLDALLENFSVVTNECANEELRPLTLWVPKSHKEKYDNLQARTKRRFGKKLKEVFILAINKTEALDETVIDMDDAS